MSASTSLPTTHNAIATTAKGVLSTIQVATPVPGPEDVLVKVSYASLVALDTYFLDSAFLVQQYPVTLGFNASGIVAAVGQDVKNLKVGDRVTAFTFGASKAMQEYALLPYTVVAKIPASLPLDAAATIPDNFATAYFTMFDQLGLPVPKTLGLAEKVEEKPEQADTPILIYGAGATSGQYTVQLLHAAGYRNIITTSSERHHSYLKSLGATHTLSYTSPTLIADILRIAPGKIHYALDCIGVSSTISAVNAVLAPGGTVAFLLPIKKGDKITPEANVEERFTMELPEEFKVGALGKEGGAKAVGIKVFYYQENEFMRLNLMPKILPSLLESGLIRPNRLRLLDESVHQTLQGRVEFGLDLLRNNKISGEKVIVKVAA